MKKLLFSTTLLAALLLSACGDTNDEFSPVESTDKVDSLKISGGDPDGRESKANYLAEGNSINTYYEPDTVRVYFSSNSQGCFTTCFGVYAISSPGNLSMTEENWWGGNNEYATYYSDTTYYKKTSCSQKYIVSAMPLNSISITADKDFDAEHPAGSQLSDLFVLQYASAYNLIKSGYDDDLNICRRHAGSLDAFQVMPLSEFEPINLLHYHMELYFTKLPDVLGEYTFTIAFEYGADPVSGKEANKIAPVVIKAEFTEADYVEVPVHEPLNKGE